MKKLFAVLVAATFAATSFAALAQEKGGKDKAKASTMDKKPADSKAKSKDKAKSKGKAKDAK